MNRYERWSVDDLRNQRDELRGAIDRQREAIDEAILGVTEISQQLTQMNNRAFYSVPVAEWSTFLARMKPLFELRAAGEPEAATP